MSKKSIWIVGILVMLVIVSVGWWYFQHNVADNTDNSNNSVSVTIPPELDTRVVLEPQNGAPDPADVSITAENGGTLIDLSMAGIQDAPYMAAIFSGTCATISPERKRIDLGDVIDGRSKTLLSITPSELAQQLPLSIAVSRDEEARTVLACGEIAPKSIPNK